METVGQVEVGALVVGLAALLGLVAAGSGSHGAVERRDAVTPLEDLLELMARRAAWERSEVEREAGGGGLVVGLVIFLVLAFIVAGVGQGAGGGPFP